MAAVRRDYYDVLGVPRQANEQTIRRAFRALAREWHPDVAEAPGAEEQFRELAEAYSVLSRRESRVLYDRYGYRGRGNDGFSETLWEARPRAHVRGADVHAEVEVRSYEAERGARRVLTFGVTARCPACAGRGSRGGSPDPQCSSCLGNGRRQTFGDLDAAHLLQIEPCPDCVGERCRGCGGSGSVEVARRIRVRIPPHVEDGTQLRVGGEGHDAGPGSVPGHLLVSVRVLPPPEDPTSVRYVAFVLMLVALAMLVLYVAH